MPVRFYLHTKTYADGRRPVYADIRWGRGAAAGDQEARLRTSTGQSCQPKNWNEDKQRIKSGETGYLKANNKLADLETAAGKLIERAELDGELLTAEQLLAKLKPDAQPRKKTADPSAVPGEDPSAVPAVRTMATLFADWQKAYRGRRAAKTLAGPKGLIDQLELFHPGIRPEDLQPDAAGRCELLEEFCVFCIEQARNRQGEVGLYNNTISSYLKRLRKLLKFGRYEYEWIEDDFSEEVEREPLSFDEVRQLYHHPVQDWREGGTRHAARAAIRDVFVFNCLTGPRYSSLQEVGPDAVVTEHVDQKLVHVFEYFAYKNRRNKTKIRVPLDEMALDIWRRYGGRLPVPSLAKMNEEIKLLCREAGITRTVKVVRGSGANRKEERFPLWKTVSAHIARYTFITTQYEGGSDLVSIQDSVGHADISTTRKYTKQREKDRLSTIINSSRNLRERGTPE